MADLADLAELSKRVISTAAASVKNRFRQGLALGLLLVGSMLHVIHGLPESMDTMVAHG